MASRPSGVKKFTNADSTDQVVVAYPVNIYSIDISWIGQTVGDRIILHDHASAALGNKVWEFVIPTAAGSFSPNMPAVGKICEKGIYLNPQLSDNTVGKFKINIGLDGV